MTVLKGKRVIDVTQSVAGPTCTLLLAYLGAEVIKVESPDGDSARHWGPPFLGEFGSLFAAFNRGKRTQQLDLKSDEGRQALHDLVRDGHILVQNFRPQTARKLGIDFDSASKINPNIVHCSITGFGNKGPRKHQPGYDALMQAFSGIMHLTGETDGPPVRTGPGVLDIGAGMLGCIGVLSALLAQAEEGARATKVETSLVETAAFFLNDRIVSYFMGVTEQQRMGSAREGLAPYENYRTQDGFVLIAANTPRFWTALCEALRLDRLLADDRYATNQARVVNRIELRGEIESATASMTRAELVELLQERHVPCEKVNNLGEFLNDPQVQALGLLAKTVTEFGSLQGMGMPFSIDGQRTSLGTPPRLPQNAGMR